MMWRIKTFAIAALVAVSALSCGSAGQYGYLEPEEISVARLKELYKGAPVEIEGNYVITGTVVSDDQYGNFYKTVVIEDSTAGIEIKLDMEHISGVYGVRSRVKVYCKSLTLGAYGGLIQLGTAPAGGYETGYISAEDISRHIVDTYLPDREYRPLELSLEQLTVARGPEILCRRVAFRNVRFLEAADGASWCEVGEDTDRTLVDDKGNYLTVRTSAYARFASFALPEGYLYIEGVLSWFNGSYQLRVINESAAVTLQDVV